MTLIEILTQARDLITNPTRWTTDTLARCENMVSISPSSPDAICWCAAGALWKVGGSSIHIDEAVDALTNACEVLYNKLIDETNDDLGHEAVIAAYNHAIKEIS